MKLFRMSINQVKKVLEDIIVGADLGVISMVAELKGLLSKKA